MGGGNVVRLNTANQGYGFGIVGPLGNGTTVSSDSLGFANDLVTGLQQVTSLNLSQIQVSGVLGSLSLDHVDGLKQLGTKTVLDTILPQLTGDKKGLVTTAELTLALQSVAIPKIEIPEVTQSLTVEAPFQDLVQPEGLASQGKPMVVNVATGETVFVATANVDEVNPNAPVTAHEVGLNKTEVRSLTKVEIQILQANGNVGALDKVFVPVGMKAAEVIELLKGIQGNVILGEVLLIPVLGGKITIKSSVLNKIAVAGGITIVNSDLENVRLSTENGSIEKSIIIGAKIEGEVDVHQSIVINSNIADNSSIKESLIQYAEIESRSNISRSQIIGTEQKPIYVNPMNNVHQYHMLGSRKESKVLAPFMQAMASPEFVRDNMRALLEGQPVLVHNTGIDSPLYNQARNSKTTRILEASEIKALRSAGILISPDAVIRVAEGIGTDHLLAMVQPGAVLSGVITFNTSRDVRISNGAVVNNVEFGEAVIIEKNSIVSDSFLDNVNLYGSTVRNSYLKRVIVEEEAVILNSTLVNDKRNEVVGKFSNVINSHLKNISVVRYSLIGNTFMENENGETVIGGSIFGQNVKFADELNSVTALTRRAFTAFLKEVDPSLELDSVRFASGKTNEILFQINEEGKVTVTVMADINGRDSVVDQWARNPRQLASRFFILGLLARPNIPYIEAITPQLERVADGESVGFRVDVVEMAERRAGEQTLTGREVTWDNPDERVELVSYIDGKIQDEDAAKTRIINLIDRLAESADTTGNTDSLKDVLGIFEDNISKSRGHYKRIADIVKGLKSETKALLQDLYQYEFIVR